VLLGTEEPRWGLEIIELTGRPSGSVYLLLDRTGWSGTARAAAAVVVGDDRYRDQWEADVVGARELGMSPLSVVCALWLLCLRRGLSWLGSVRWVSR
jgi:hypothetical protein